MKYGVTLTQLRELFLGCYSLPRTSAWIESFAGQLASADSRVPVKALLDGLEGLKHDVKSAPTVSAVRQIVPSLKQFEPEKLEATIRAIRAIVGEKWVELDERRGAVYLHQSPDQIVAEAQRVLSDEFGEDYNKPPPV